MNFWEAVDEELKFLGKSRKELGAEADFDPSYISKGIARNGIPNADLAVRIARSLGVTVEYLVDGKNQNSGGKESVSMREILLCRKYAAAVRKLEQMENDRRTVFLRLLDMISQQGGSG
ncbi:MAG: helix-turn-helix transcriptional regulator [Treponema sp.]|nr:helix-turn-helix transcriptional regulator [Treponema sp.]